MSQVDTLLAGTYTAQDRRISPLTCFSLFHQEAMMPGLCVSRRDGVRPAVSVLLVVLLLITGTLVAAAGSNEPQGQNTGNAGPAPDATNGLETLIVNTGAYPSTGIDPQVSSLVNAVAHLRLIYEGLTRLDQQLRTVPAAAESWQYNATGTELTFTLRPGLTYSDGSVLNAERYRYSILRNIDPATAGAYAEITDEIVGAREWRTGSGTRQGVAIWARNMSGQPCTGYQQADCRRLTMVLRHPATYFHTVLSLVPAFPAKEENITAGGSNWWQNPQYQIGNGPFILQELTANVRGRFAPNPRYWRGMPTYNLEFRYIADSSLAFAAYKSGKLDITPASPADMAEILASPTLSHDLLRYPGSCTFAIFFDNQTPPFQDRKVREAFAYALDRDRWVTSIMAGGGYPTLTWIAPGYPGYDSTESRWAFDPAKAVAALAASTYGSPANLPPISFTFTNSPRNIARYQWLTNRWHDILGVTVTLDPVPSPDYSEAQMFSLGWCADFPDQQNWLSVYWHTRGMGARQIGFSDPALDALLDQADATVDPQARTLLYDQAQDRLVGDLPVAFFYNNMNAYLVRGRVNGVITTPQDSDWAGSNDPLAITVEPWKKTYLPLVIKLQ